MLILASVLFAAAIGMLCVALGLVGLSNRRIKARLVVLGTPAQPKTTRAPRRLLTTTEAVHGVKKLVSPPFLIEMGERNLVLAGRPPGWSIGNLLIAKGVLGTVCAAFMVAFVVTKPGLNTTMLALILVILAYALPDVLLHGRAVERQKRIEKDLPDILDQATIAIESGLSFEASLARVGASAQGPLAEEILRTVQDMRLGMSRRDAYAALSGRTTVGDLKRFSKSIVQAEEFGVPVANVVRNLADEMRMKRKYKAEAKALQIPVKMLFPLIICIFPVLFVVVLFPAYMDLGATLSGQ